MKRKLLKSLSLLTAVLMLMCILPFGIFAEDGIPINVVTAAATLPDMIGDSTEVTCQSTIDDVEISEIVMSDCMISFMDSVTDDEIGEGYTVPAGTVLDPDDFPTAPEHEGLEFSGWDYDGHAIYSDTVVTALYYDPNAIGFYFEPADGDPTTYGWTMEDRDGDGNNWRWMTAEGIAYPEGEGCMNSQSYINYVGPLYPDNWLVSPEVPGNGMVSFMLCAQDGSYADEHIGVYASTDGGETWSEELGYFTPKTPSSVFTYTVSLAEYAGMNIKLAFRHYDSSDNFSINLDAVEVSANSSETPTDNPAPSAPPVGSTLINGYLIMANNWGSFSEDDPANVTMHGVAPQPVFSAAYAEGTVYGYIANDGTYKFFIMDPITFEMTLTSNTIVELPVAMAYNKANAQMYAVASADGGVTTDLYTVDITSGTLNFIAELSTPNGEVLASFTIDDAGNGYALNGTDIGGNAKLWNVDIATGACTEIGETGKAHFFLQSITYDYATDRIYWAQMGDFVGDAGLYVIDPATGAATFCGQINGTNEEVLGLWIADDGEEPPTEEPPTEEPPTEEPPTEEPPTEEPPTEEPPTEEPPTEEPPTETPTEPPTPPTTGFISLAGAGIAAILTGAGIVLFRRKRS